MPKDLTAADFTPDEVVAIGQNGGHSPEEIADALQTYRDGMRDHATSVVAGDPDYGPESAWQGMSAVDHAIAPRLAQLQFQQAAQDVVPAAIKTPAERHQFLSTFYQAKGDEDTIAAVNPDWEAPTQAMNQRLGELAQKPAFKFPTPQVHAPQVLDSDGQPIADYQFQPQHDGTADVFLHIYQPGQTAAGMNQAPVPSLLKGVKMPTNADVDSQKADLQQKLSGIDDMEQNFQTAQEYGGPSYNTAEVQKQRLDTQQQLDLMNSSAAKPFLFKQNVAAALQNSPDAAKVGTGSSGLGEDLYRGAASLFNNVRGMWHDLTGNTEARAQDLAISQGLSSAYPGATGLGFRQGVGGAVRGVTEMAGSVAPSLATMPLGGGATALAFGAQGAADSDMRALQTAQQLRDQAKAAPDPDTAARYNQLADQVESSRGRYAAMSGALQGGLGYVMPGQPAESFWGHLLRGTGEMGVMNAAQQQGLDPAYLGERGSMDDWLKSTAMGLAFPIAEHGGKAALRGIGAVKAAATPTPTTPSGTVAPDPSVVDPQTHAAGLAQAAADAATKSAAAGGDSLDQAVASAASVPQEAVKAINAAAAPDTTQGSDAAAAQAVTGNPEPPAVPAGATIGDQVPMATGEPASLTDALTGIQGTGAQYKHPIDGEYRGNWKFAQPGQGEAGREVKLADGRTGRVTGVDEDSGKVTVKTDNGEHVPDLDPKTLQAKLTPDEQAIEPHVVQRMGNFAKLKGDFDSRLQAVADAVPGAVPITAPLKGAPRALEKQGTKVEDSRRQSEPAPTPAESAADLKDILRGSIVVDSMDQVPAAIQKVKQQFGEHNVTVKNRFEKPTEAGYSDVQMNVTVAPGHVAELQIHLPEMLAAKEGNGVKEMKGLPEKYHPENLGIAGLDAAKPGHKLYEKYRSLPEGSPEKPVLEARMKGLYGAALDAYLARLARTASANSAKGTFSDTELYGSGGLPLKGTTRPSIATPKVLLPETATGDRSQSESQNSAPGGNIAGVRSTTESTPPAVPAQVRISVDNIHHYAGQVDASGLKGKGQDTWRFFDKAAYTAAGAQAKMVPLDKLVSTKNELEDPKFKAGQKDDPRQNAIKGMEKAWNGDPADPTVKRRAPLDVRDNGDGTYTVLDGNATSQAAMLAGWKEDLPVRITEHAQADPGAAPLSFSQRPTGEPAEGSVGPDGRRPQGVPRVLPSHAEDAVKLLNQSAAGRQLTDGAIIVRNWKEALAHPDLQGRKFRPEDLAAMKTAEGFHDPTSGRSVVMRDQIGVREGETAPQAIARVLLHERVGHEGASYMYRTSPEFRRDWQEITKLIPPDELGAIAHDSPEMAHDTPRLVGEWFARQVEALPPGDLPKPGSLLSRAWDAVSGFVSRLWSNSGFSRESSTGKSLNGRVRDLAGAILEGGLQPHNRESSLAHPPDERMPLVMAGTPPLPGAATRSAKQVRQRIKGWGAVHDVAKLDGKTGADVLKQVAHAERNAPALKPLIKRLLSPAVRERLGNVKIKVIEPGQAGWGSDRPYYHEGVIHVPRGATVTSRQLLHELIHGYTADALFTHVSDHMIPNASGDAYRRGLQRLMVDGNTPAPVKRLANLYLHTVDRLGLTKEYFSKGGRAGDDSDPANASQYGLTNLHEFVAEAFSNGHFQNVLKGLDATLNGTSQKTSVWTAFKGAVRDMIGLREDSHGTLDAVLDATQQLGQLGTRNQEPGTRSSQPGPSPGTGSHLQFSKIGDFGRNVKDEWRKLGEVPKLTPVKAAGQRWLGGMQRNTLSVERVMHEVESRVKDPLKREAITNWIEAKGDAATLAQQAAASNAKNRPGYEAALHLTPEELAIAGRARDIYDKFGKQFQAAGVLKGWQQDYVNHAWNFDDTSGAQRTKVGQFTGQITQRFANSQQRTLGSFFEGEQRGLTPATKDISKLLGAYIYEGNKAVLGRGLAADLLKGKTSDGKSEPLAYLAGRGTSEEDAKTGKPGPIMVDPNARANALKIGEDDNGNIKTTDGRKYQGLDELSGLRGWKWMEAADNGQQVFSKGDMLLHPEAYKYLQPAFGRDKVTDYLRQDSDNMALNAAKKLGLGVIKAQSLAKEFLFGFGGFHVIQEGTHAVGHWVNPIGSIEHIDADNPEHADAMLHGLMLSHDSVNRAQFIEGLGAGGRTLEKIPGLGRLAKVMSDFTFKDFIPSLKIQTYRKALERNLQRYAGELRSGRATTDDVKYLTAKEVNQGYGHLNKMDTGWGKTTQRVMSSFLLAPDFLEARARFAIGAANDLAHGRFRSEQAMAMGTLAAVFYGAARAMNALLNDGDAKMDLADAFTVVHGNRRYTMRSVPEDVMSLVKDPRKFIHGRVSPYMQTFVDLYYGQNYRGEHMSGGRALEETLLRYIPIAFRWAADYGAKAATDAVPALKNAPVLSGLTDSANRNPVSPLEQFYGSIGLHVSRYSPITETQRLASAYLDKSEPDQRQAAVYPVSVYDKMRRALEDNDTARALAEYKALIQPNRTAAQLDRSFHQSTFRPWTGSTEKDKAFTASLTDDQKALKSLGDQRKNDVWNRFEALKRAR